MDDDKAKKSEDSENSDDQSAGDSSNSGDSEGQKASESESAEDSTKPEDSDTAAPVAPLDSADSTEKPNSDEAPAKEELSQPSEESSGQSADSLTLSEASDYSDATSAGSEPSDPNAPRARWYVVHTYSGHEAKVAATLKQRVESQKLQDKVLDILVPTQEKIEIKEGKKNTIKEKIFPGYLLIRMVLDDTSWLAVRTTPGITSFVGNANRPTPLSEDEVSTIKRFMTMEAPKFKTAFSQGEAIKIIEGPFAEFLGSISEIDEEKGKLKVMVSIFGRETPVELDFLQVAKL